MKLSEYSYRNFQFLGNSEGGTHTCIALPQYRLLFDTGVGSARLTEYPLILLSHGHLDHASGLAYLISQRSLRKLAPPEIYVPPEVYEPLTQIMKLWGDIEDYHSQYHLHAVDYNRHYPLKGESVLSRDSQQPSRSLKRILHRREGAEAEARASESAR